MMLIIVWSAAGAHQIGVFSVDEVALAGRGPSRTGPPGRRDERRSSGSAVGVGLGCGGGVGLGLEAGWRRAIRARPQASGRATRPSASRHPRSAGRDPEPDDAAGLPVAPGLSRSHSRSSRSGPAMARAIARRARRWEVAGGGPSAGPSWDPAEDRSRRPVPAGSPGQVGSVSRSRPRSSDTRNGRSSPRAKPPAMHRILVHDPPGGGLVGRLEDRDPGVLRAEGRTDEDDRALGEQALEALEVDRPDRPLLGRSSSPRSRRAAGG